MWACIAGHFSQNSEQSVKILELSFRVILLLFIIITTYTIIINITTTTILK